MCIISLVQHQVLGRKLQRSLASSDCVELGKRPPLSQLASPPHPSIPSSLRNLVNRTFTSGSSKLLILIGNRDLQICQRQTHLQSVRTQREKDTTMGEFLEKVLALHLSYILGIGTHRSPAIQRARMATSVTNGFVNRRLACR